MARQAISFARAKQAVRTNELPSVAELLKSVLQTQRVHLYPFRTQKLSSAVVKILYGRLYGKIAQCRHRTEGNGKPFPSPEKRRKANPNNSALCIQHYAFITGVQLSWESTCPASRGSWVRIPSSPPNQVKRNHLTNHIGSQLSRLERVPDKHEVGGSSPLGPTSELNIREFVH